MGELWFPMCLPRPLERAVKRPGLPAKNDNAVRQIHRGVWFAGKPGSYRRRTMTRCDRYTAASGSPASLNWPNYSGHLLRAI